MRSTSSVTSVGSTLTIRSATVAVSVIAAAWTCSWSSQNEMRTGYAPPLPAPVSWARTA